MNSVVDLEDVSTLSRTVFLELVDAIEAGKQRNVDTSIELHSWKITFNKADRKGHRVADWKARSPDGALFRSMIGLKQRFGDDIAPTPETASEGPPSETTPSEAAPSEAGGEEAVAEVVTCAACNGAHRAHTCGKRGELRNAHRTNPLKPGECAACTRGAHTAHTCGKRRGEYVVERILDERPAFRYNNVRGDITEYLVSWVGYSDQTWEPFDHLHDNAVFLEYQAAKRQRLLGDTAPPPPSPAAAVASAPAAAPAADDGAAAAIEPLVSRQATAPAAAAPVLEAPAKDEAPDVGIAFGPVVRMGTPVVEEPTTEEEPAKEEEEAPPAAAPIKKPPAAKPKPAAAAAPAERRRTSRGAPSTEAAAAPPADVQHLAVGTRLAVWWPREKLFYPGAVSGYESDIDHKGKLRWRHRVAYDDGDVGLHDLETVRRRPRHPTRRRRRPPPPLPPNR